MSPTEVGRLSVYQFNSAVAGWNAAQGGAPEPPTDAEFDAMLEASAASAARALPGAKG